MKKFVPIITFALIMLFSFSITSNVKATNQVDLKVGFENAKLIKSEKLKAEKVDKKKQKFDDMLKKQGIDEETLREEGDFYYDPENDHFVMQIKKQIKDANKNKKFQNLKNSKKEKYSVATTNDVIIEEVNYSYEELVKMQDEFFNINNKKLFSKNTILTLDSKNNRLELLTDSININLKQSLENKYDDKLYINIDPDFVTDPVPLKARKADWNQLGSGIGVRSNGQCTTAGVAYKSTGNFIITAGHCINSIGTTAYQWFTPVGTAHLNALLSQFDFGLIKINRPNDLTGGRYASNGLYINGKSSNGYDVAITGAVRPYDNMLVCKTGITTGYTCGKVADSRVLHPALNTVSIRVVSGNSHFASKGDSGGALTNYSNGTYKIVGLTSAANKFDFSSYEDGQYATEVYFTPIIESLQKYDLYYYTSNIAKKL
jgi:hypothetical protein